VTDGLSSTLFVGEWESKDTPSRYTFWANTYAQYAMAGASNPAVAGVWTFGPPSYFGCDNGAGGNPCKRTWGSFHTGGIHFLLGDGAIRFISANISYPTFMALCTIANSEVVADF
jgi:hypothetical protein